MPLPIFDPVQHFAITPQCQVVAKDDFLGGFSVGSDAPNLLFLWQGPSQNLKAVSHLGPELSDLGQALIYLHCLLLLFLERVGDIPAVISLPAVARVQHFSAYS